MMEYKNMFRCTKCGNTFKLEKKSGNLYYYYHTHKGKQCSGGSFERVEEKANQC
jgi:hypothetical protein